MWQLLILLMSAGSIYSLSAIDKGSLYGKKEKDRLVHVSAVEGQPAELPCDVTPPARGDALRLVLWYFGTEGTIYTYDARGHGGGVTGSHWASNALGGERLQFQADTVPASLRITSVSRVDGGMYRCRVDYLLSPTQNSRVNLTVIVPPQKPVVLDSSGRRLPDNTLGPYRLGSSVNVTCATFDGSPVPNVTWWRGGSQLGGGWRPAPDGSVTAPLVLGPLTRADHGTSVTCMAAFHPFSAALSTAMVIRMLLPPESVTLRAPAVPMVAGHPVTLTCQVTGSQPEPVISWHVGSVLSPAGQQQASLDGNGTVSRLNFTPGVADQGQKVRCTAANPAAGERVIEDVLTLHVHYPPVVSLSLRPEKPLRTGQTARLHCSVRAEPAVTQVRWRHQTRWLPEQSLEDAQTAPNGSRELVLANVLAQNSGAYVCQATNPLGITESQPVTLRVQHVPVCSSDAPTVLEAARGDKLNVSCRVDAFPEALTYKWGFNSSDPLLTQQELSSRLQNGSTLHYSPQLPSEFGTLLCWATNALGEQCRPCVYLIQSADVPDPPFSCDVTSRTSSSLLVRCQPGFDGGSRQIFRMEVYSSSDIRLTNVSSVSPRLRVTGLRPDQQYSLSVYAVNSHGSSAVAALLGRTLAAEHAAEPHHGSLVDLLQLTPILGVLIGVVTALVLTAAIIAGTRCYRARPQPKENQQGVAHVQLVNNFSDLGGLEEKHDPDLIPQKTEFMDPEEKHMIERLRNSRFPPPPARFGDGVTSLSSFGDDVMSPSSYGDDVMSPSSYGDGSASPREMRILSPTSKTLPRPERVSSCGTQTGSQSPRKEQRNGTMLLMRSTRRRSASPQRRLVATVSNGHLSTKF